MKRKGCRTLYAPRHCAVKRKVIQDVSHHLARGLQVARVLGMRKHYSKTCYQDHQIGTQPTVRKSMDTPRLAPTPGTVVAILLRCNSRDHLSSRRIVLHDMK